MKTNRTGRISADALTDSNLSFSSNVQARLLADIALSLRDLVDQRAEPDMPQPDLSPESFLKPDVRPMRYVATYDPFEMLQPVLDDLSIIDSFIVRELAERRRSGVPPYIEDAENALNAARSVVDRLKAPQR